MFFFYLTQHQEIKPSNQKDLFECMQPSGSSCFLFSPRSRVDVDKKTNALIYITYPSHVCSTWNQGAPIQWCLIEGLGFYLGLLELERKGKFGFKIGPI